MKIWGQDERVFRGEILSQATVPCPLAAFVLGARDPACIPGSRAYAGWLVRRHAWFSMPTISQPSESLQTTLMPTEPQKAWDPYAAPIGTTTGDARHHARRGWSDYGQARQFNTPKALLEAADPVATVGQAFDRDTLLNVIELLGWSILRWDWKAGNLQGRSHQRHDAAPLRMDATGSFRRSRQASGDGAMPLSNLGAEMRPRNGNAIPTAKDGYPNHAGQVP